MEIAYPFDAGPGATVGEAEWQRMAREWLRTGVLTGRLNQLAVSADGSGLSVSVASGAAWIEGHYYRSDAAKALAIGTADPTNPRIDTVVARLDRSADTITTAVKAGTPAASPAAPALTQTDALYELPLADVLVDAAAGVIAAGKVTDRRAFTGPFDSAAYVAKDAAVTAELSAGPETTTSTSFADLATVGPTRTVTVGPSGRVLVVLSAQIYNLGANIFSSMSVALSGANTSAANVDRQIQGVSPSTDNGPTVTGVQILGGLAPGSTTFTAKYSANQSTAVFYRRRLTVIPL